MEDKKLTPGTIINSADEDHEIASWRTRDEKSFFARIFFYDGTQTNEPSGWFGISNHQYQGAGLIVFIKDRPKRDQKLRIRNVGKNAATADIID